MNASWEPIDNNKYEYVSNVSNTYDYSKIVKLEKRIAALEQKLIVFENTFNISKIKNNNL